VRYELIGALRYLDGREIPAVLDDIKRSLGVQRWSRDKLVRRRYLR
jgi:hypothetical protein